jgi:broad specificity phosphatase PhoE
MEISLIRHGKSKHIENNRVTCKEFLEWVERYDNSGVFEENDYPSETLKKIAAASIVITSDLTRSVESANLIIQNRNTRKVTDALFRETELPVPSWNLKFKMRANSWAVILRCLWFCGYARRCESLAEAKQRAKKASEQLVKYAEEYNKVVLVGHGFFNSLIAVELKKMGWRGKRKATAKHWHCTTYSEVFLNEER